LKKGVILPEFEDPIGYFQKVVFRRSFRPEQMPLKKHDLKPFLFQFDTQRKGKGEWVQIFSHLMATVVGEGEFF